MAISSGLVGTFSDITYYINGFRYQKTGIPNKTYTASKDTYVFIDTNGVVTYSEVANGATAPSTPASSILVAVVVTSAGAITSVSIKNRGAIKGEDIDYSTMQSFSSRLTNGTGVRSTTSSTTPTPMTGAYKYTNLLDRPVTVMLMGSVMMHATSTAGAPRVILDARSDPSTVITTVGQIAFTDQSTAWGTYPLMGSYTVPAGASVWLGIS